MSDPPLWFVRAGEGGAYAPDFRATNSVGIGWNEVGPITPETPDEEIHDRFAKTYSDKEKKTFVAWANQVRRFLREIRAGDAVVTYDPTERIYLIGRIDSDIEWRNGVLPRRRAVTWTHRVKRETLSESARNKLGSIAMLFQVGPEAKSELMQNASPLQSEAAPMPISAPGRQAPGLVPQDFDVLRRNTRSIPWPTLPEADRGAIKNLRQRLLQCAEKLRDDLGSTLTLKPFASHPTPSGRNASFYWACVYPQNAATKSFAYQLFVIVRPENVEFGFGSGSATGEMDESKLNELRAQFESQRGRLKSLRDVGWVAAMGASAVQKDFKFRTRWLQPTDGPSDFADLPAWIDHAASGTGGGAAISRMLSPEEVLAHGGRFGDFLVHELKQFVPLLDAIYSAVIASDVAPSTPLPTAMPRSVLSIEWLVEETLWERNDIERVLDTLTTKHLK